MMHAVTSMLSPTMHGIIRFVALDLAPNRWPMAPSQFRLPHAPCIHVPPSDGEYSRALGDLAVRSLRPPRAPLGSHRVRIFATSSLQSRVQGAYAASETAFSYDGRVVAPARCEDVLQRRIQYHALPPVEK